MNRVQEMEEKISNIEDKIEKSDTFLKQNALKKNNSSTKLSGTLYHYEKTKSKNYE